MRRKKQCVGFYIFGKPLPNASNGKTRYMVERVDRGLQGQAIRHPQTKKTNIDELRLDEQSRVASLPFDQIRMSCIW